VSGKYGTPHKRAREALLPLVVWGETPCSICTHPLYPGDEVDLDHDDDGVSYRGFAHHSPCRICGRRCNQAAGGELAAVRAGKQLRRGRRCVVCGLPYTAGSGSAGAAQVTCGGQPCITELRSRRKAREPDGEPPAPTGRVW
jgi:hypothetical protein